jgi:hypothetical protein
VSQFRFAAGQNKELQELDKYEDSIESSHRTKTKESFNGSPTKQPGLTLSPTQSTPDEGEGLAYAQTSRYALPSPCSFHLIHPRRRSLQPIERSYKSQIQLARTKTDERRRLAISKKTAHAACHRQFLPSAYVTLPPTCCPHECLSTHISLL